MESRKTWAVPDCFCSIFVEPVLSKVSIIPSKTIPVELYFDGISHTELRESVKIPAIKFRGIPRNEIPWNSAERNSVEKLWRNSLKIPAEFLENSGGTPWESRRNSKKILAGFCVYNGYFYEPLRNSNNTFFHINWFIYSQIFYSISLRNNLT